VQLRKEGGMAFRLRGIGGHRHLLLGNQLTS
jgi:hypothetical protein